MHAPGKKKKLFDVFEKHHRSELYSAIKIFFFKNYVPVPLLSSVEMFSMGLATSRHPSAVYKWHSPAMGISVT